METRWSAIGDTAVLAPAAVSTADEATGLHDALLGGFADADAVVCDLAAVVDDAGGPPGPEEDAALAGALAGVAERVSPWPSAVLAVAAPRAGVRAALLGRPPTRALLVADDRATACALVERRPGPRAVRSVLDPLLQAPALGRAFLRRTLAGWGDDTHLDDALVVVDELVANAVLHAGTEVELRLSLLDGRLGVAVADRAPGRPTAGDPGEHAEGGRGLLLVDALAEGWHVLPRRDGGKIVRAVLPVQEPAAESRPPLDLPPQGRAAVSD